MLGSEQDSYEQQQQQHTDIVNRGVITEVKGHGCVHVTDDGVATTVAEER